MKHYYRFRVSSFTFHASSFKDNTFEQPSSAIVTPYKISAASIVARAHFLEQLAILGAEFGMELPKGAANHVIEAGKAFVAKHGRESLRKVAKLHFKTTDLVLSNHA